MWLAAGLVLGLGVATVALLGGYIPDTVPTKPTANPNQPQPQSPDEITIIDETVPEPDTTGPATPHYDFYTRLEERKVQTPANTPGPPKADSTQRYLLQVGSFRDAGDAETLKAELAFLGLVAQIQPVTVADGKWYRVRIGPYLSKRDRERAVHQLQAKGIEPMLITDPG